MKTSLFPLLVLWAAMAAGVIVMIVWRKTVDRKEDDSLHVLHAEALPMQVEIAAKLALIDKWGKTLTGITVIYGIIIAAIYVYQTWVTASTTVMG